MSTLQTELERLHGRFPDAAPYEWLEAVLASLYAYHETADVREAFDQAMEVIYTQRFKEAMLAQLENL